MRSWIELPRELTGGVPSSLLLFSRASSCFAAFDLRYRTQV